MIGDGLALDFSLDSSVVELGDSLSGTVTRYADMTADDNTRSIRIELRYRTEGRGDTNKATVAETTIPLDSSGNAIGPFSLLVPRNSPVSYDGRLLRVIWEVDVTVDRKRARDDVETFPVLVLPVNGKGIYTGPLPLPVAPPPPQASDRTGDMPPPLPPHDRG